MLLAERSRAPHWEPLISLKQAPLQHPAANSPSTHSLDDDIVAEHFTRNVQFFGREAQQKIMGSFVVVVGLGVSEQVTKYRTSLLSETQELLVLAQQCRCQSACVHQINFNDQCSFPIK